MKAKAAGQLFLVWNDKKCGNCKRYDNCYIKSSMLLGIEKNITDYEETKQCPACVDFVDGKEENSVKEDIKTT